MKKPQTLNLRDREVALSFLQQEKGKSEEAFFMALLAVVRARGVQEVAQVTGLNRTSLYRITQHDVRYDTVRKLLDALGISIVLETK